VNLLAMIKEKWGLVINDCEATTGWTVSSGTGTLSVVAVDTASKNANYKEYGSYELKATGTASSGGSFLLTYTLPTVVDFTGALTSEYATGWISYLSYWVKGMKTGTIRVKLVDGAGKTAYWDNTLTVTAPATSQQKYFHLTLASPTASDSGFTLTTISSIIIGYVSRTNGETSMELHLDGLRIQGDPTFDLFTWTTQPIDDKMLEPTIGVTHPRTFPARRRGYSAEIAEEVRQMTIGPTPLMLIKRPLRIAYQLVSDPLSNRSEGKIRKWRDYIYKELRRIVSKYPTYKAAQGLSYMTYKSHVEDDNFTTRPIRTRGYIDLRVFLWRNNYTE
jgi:hypothetical protein